MIYCISKEASVQPKQVSVLTTTYPKAKIWRGDSVGLIVLQMSCYCKCSVALPHGLVCSV